MATNRYTVTETLSDLSDEVGAETVLYSVNGTKYAIDLTEAEAKDFHEALAPYISVSRVKGGQPKQRTNRKAAAEETAAIRAWAAENGHEVNPTGRIPNQVREAYEAAQGTGKRTRKAKATA